MRRNAWWMWVVLLGAGCPMDSEEDTGKESAETGDTGAAGVESATVSGTVSRTAPLATDGDGIGMLFVAAFDACSATPVVLGASGTPGADLSSETAAVPFTIASLPLSTVYLALFLDEDGNADPMAPLPEVGDLVYGTNAGDGQLDCVAVDLAGGDQGAVALELNLLEE